MKKAPAKKPAVVGCVIDDDPDEMAFPDSQIDMVQNSHGRQVEGTGGGYRTIINGTVS